MKNHDQDYECHFVKNQGQNSVSYRHGEAEPHQAHPVRILRRSSASARSLHGISFEVVGWCANLWMLHASSPESEHFGFCRSFSSFLRFAIRALLYPHRRDLFAHLRDTFRHVGSAAPASTRCAFLLTLLHQAVHSSVFLVKVSGRRLRLSACGKSEPPVPKQRWFLLLRRQIFARARVTGTVRSDPEHRGSASNVVASFAGCFHEHCFLGNRGLHLLYRSFDNFLRRFVLEPLGVFINVTPVIAPNIRTLLRVKLPNTHRIPSLHGQFEQWSRRWRGYSPPREPS